MLDQDARGLAAGVVGLEGDPVGERLDELDRGDLASLRVAARATAEQYSWPEIARRYLELVETLREERGERS